jgi:hypothetical protein
VSVEPWGYAAMMLGAALVLWSLIEVWLTIYHKDLDGPATRALQSAVWRVFHLSGRTWRDARRMLLSFAGPVMVLATFGLWVVLFLLGSALMVWPNLAEGYRTEDELGDLGFIDALYYAGVTGTVLGYGDITPLTPLLKVLTFFISGYGFILLGGGITYLLSVVNGASRRNVLALRVRAATHRTGDGVLLIQDAMQRQEPGDVRERLRSRGVQQLPQQRYGAHRKSQVAVRRRLPLAAGLNGALADATTVEAALLFAGTLIATATFVVAARTSRRQPA